MIFFADITILVFSYFLISRSSSAPKNPVSGCILYCMSLCLHWKPPSGFYSSMIALVPPALKAFYLSDNTMCSAPLWQPLHPSTHKSPHPVISPSHLKSIYQKKALPQFRAVNLGSDQRPGIIHRDEQPFHCAAGCLWNAPRWFFSVRSICQRHGGRGSNMSPLNEFLPRAPENPRYM